jgi:hypothetical protein
MSAAIFLITVVETGDREYQSEVHGRFLSGANMSPIIEAVGLACAQTFVGHVAHADLIAAFVTGTLAPDAPGRKIKRILNPEGESHG